MLSNSNDSLFFINKPFLAQNPSLTITAKGVARPKEQGHATTKTVTNLVKAISKLFVNRLKIKFRKAISRILGTKIELTLSATLAIAGLVLVASTTSLTISEIVESLPILIAS